jgi:selenocysteine lyase/cysteine desulfurase
VVPVKEITAMAHELGCQVIVDAAHSFAQFPLDIADINCDYLATSLHKWLCAPFGTGILFIKKERIGKVWPLLSSYESMKDNIRKFETLGTRSFGAEMAIHDALDFHEQIGQDRKTARLRYLKKYWTEKVKDLPKIRFYTSMKDQFSGGMATVGMEGWDAEEILGHLFTTQKLHATPVQHESVNGVRISPHVYTSLTELDLLVAELTAMAKR